ncbi:MAG: carboxypeptidase regulatory-like domain-containing protein [Myxococcales bacterium]|nr:carboxypeptidase regulatory-like domain-containing protein [Myxococcales bacterium]
MSVTSHAARLTLLGVLSGALGACSFSDSAASTPLMNECALDSDCSTGMCDEDLGFCVGPLEAPMTLALELRTDDRSRPGTSVTEWVPPFEVIGALTRDIELSAPIAVMGVITRADTGERVPAEVRLSRPGAFLGAPAVDVSVSTSSEPITARDGMAATFAINVVSEADYEVTVTPTGDAAGALPPLRRTVSVPGGGDFVRVDFTYPAVLSTFRGVITAPGGKRMDDLAVRAVDRVTGKPVSSQDVTGAAGESGVFTLFLPPDASSYVLRVSGTPDRSAFPTVTVDPDYLIPGVGEEPTPILVPSFKTVDLRGRCVDEGGQPVSGAMVTLSTSTVFDDATGYTGAFQASATADDGGVFEVAVPAGDYDLVFSPMTMTTVDAAGTSAMEASSVAAFHLRVEPGAGGSNDDPLEFVLPQQANIRRVVTTYDARFLRGASVQANALGRNLPGSDDASELYARSLPAGPLSEGDGSLRVRLDPGVYDLIIKPPVDVGFPWLVRPATAIKRNAEQLFFEVPSPTVLRGTVTTNGGKASADVEVRAWAVVEEATGTRLVTVARAVTGSDGSYVLLLPSSF